MMMMMVILTKAKKLQITLMVGFVRCVVHLVMQLVYPQHCSYMLIIISMAKKKSIKYDNKMADKLSHINRVDQLEKPLFVEQMMKMMMRKKSELGRLIIYSFFQWCLKTYQ